MKKSLVKKICAVVFVIAAILIVIILLQSRSASIPNFEFLKHPKPFVKNIERKESTLETRTTQYYYAFETDYKDFCARAYEELKKLNYRPGNSLIYSISEDSTADEPRFYGGDWFYRDSRGSVSVTIYRNYKLSEEEKNLQKLHTGSIYAEDCVTVIINQSQTENLLIRKIKLLVRKLRN